MNTEEGWIEGGWRGGGRWSERRKGSEINKLIKKKERNCLTNMAMDQSDLDESSLELASSWATLSS